MQVVTRIGDIGVWTLGEIEWPVLDQLIAHFLRIIWEWRDEGHIYDGRLSHLMEFWMWHHRGSSQCQSFYSICRGITTGKESIPWQEFSIGDGQCEIPSGPASSSIG